MGNEASWKVQHPQIPNKHPATRSAVSQLHSASENGRRNALDSAATWVADCTSCFKPSRTLMALGLSLCSLPKLTVLTGSRLELIKDFLDEGPDSWKALGCWSSPFFFRIFPRSSRSCARVDERGSSRHRLLGGQKCAFPTRLARGSPHYGDGLPFSSPHLL